MANELKKLISETINTAIEMEDAEVTPSPSVAECMMTAVNAVNVGDDGGLISHIYDYAEAHGHKLGDGVYMYFDGSIINFDEARVQKGREHWHQLLTEFCVKIKMQNAVDAPISAKMHMVSTYVRYVRRFGMKGVEEEVALVAGLLDQFDVILKHYGACETSATDPEIIYYDGSWLNRSEIQYVGTPFEIDTEVK